jgi:hypothetical protein
MRYVGIIKLLVLCLTLLLLTGYVVNVVIPETTSGNLGNQENTEEPTKWSGLGMDVEDMGYYMDNIPEFDGYIDTLLANGFTQLRIHMPDYADSKDITASKAAVLRAIAKGAEVIWGVCASITGTTAANWSDYRTAVLSAAAWAQANGVYEFLLGNEEERHNDGTTLTDAQLRINLRSLATEVQAIFTRGNVGYGNSCTYLSNWLTEGRGDIDQLSWMVYIDEENWKNKVDAIVANFGADHTYINEFNVDAGGEVWDEAVQAAGITEMLDYFKASGITRVFFFCYTDPFWLSGFGIRNDDGTYRLGWSQALLNSGSVKSTTVAKTTTKISLPDTIALLISKIIRKHQTRH